MTVVASIVPVRKIPRPTKKHRWSIIVDDDQRVCRDCGVVRIDRSTGWTLYAYYRGIEFLGSSAPPCTSDTAPGAKEGGK